MKNGYYVLENFLGEEELVSIERILVKFHSSWCLKNIDFYNSNAINSAYITSGEYISESERLELLKLIGSHKVVHEAQKVLGGKPCFLNSQLFFDPKNENQLNYWHRDIQYSNQKEIEQRETIERAGHEVIHLRIALRDELGIELIPGSQSKWDSDIEYDTRLENSGRRASDNLRQGEPIPLGRGDLLVFDANIIHRGLYGKNRLSFDIIFCRPDPSILQYSKSECFPKESEYQYIDHPEIFVLV